MINPKFRQPQSVFDFIGKGDRFIFEIGVTH